MKSTFDDEGDLHFKEYIEDYFDHAFGGHIERLSIDKLRLWFHFLPFKLVWHSTKDL